MAWPWPNRSRRARDPHGRAARRPRSARKNQCRSLTTDRRSGYRNLRNCRQVALAFPTLDPRDLAGHSLAQPGALEDENTLEQALIGNLQHFLLELGSEFCFVDRQYRMTLGNRHYLDLLFFHRRLRCLVAVELKTTDHLPDHDGQMRFYLNYLAKEVALPGENPPIGILLCAGKDESILQFAAVADQSIRVSRYVLELPKEAQLKQWLHEAREATEAQLRQTAARESTPAPKKPRKKPDGR